MHARIRTLAGVSALAVLALTACSSASEDGVSGGSSDNPIKVGVMMPLSGPTAAIGERQAVAIEVAVAHLNAAGGVLGRQLEIVELDDEGTPAVATSRAQELVSKKVDVIISGASSATHLASQPVISRAKIMNIATTASSPDILNGKVDPDAVRLNSPSAVTAPVTAEYINSLNPKALTYMAVADVYGDGEFALQKKALKSPPVHAERFPATQTDFRVALGNVAAKKSDVVAVINASSGSGLPALIKQFRSAGIDSQLVVSAGTLPGDFLKVLGKDAEGLVSSAAYLPDQPPFNSIDANNKFVEAFKQAKGGELPDLQGAAAYTATMVWAKAVQAAGGTDRAKVAAKIKGQAFADTVFGDVTFDKTGQMSSTQVLFKVVNGKLELL